MTDQDKLTNHNYDGIKEYDNDLPRWWVVLFWLTGIYGLLDWGYFHYILPVSPREELAMEMAAQKAVVAQQQAAASTNEVHISSDDLLQRVNNVELVRKGSEIYALRCSACHGAEGQGIIGPNLTDKNWIHGGKIDQIHNTIREGVPAKGMLSWKTLMSADDIVAVTGFVWSLHGTTPPNPKPAEGELVVD